LLDHFPVETDDVFFSIYEVFNPILIALFLKNLFTPNVYQFWGWISELTNSDSAEMLLNRPSMAHPFLK
jgi:hypothetical protein